MGRNRKRRTPADPAAELAALELDGVVKAHRGHIVSMVNRRLESEADLCNERVAIVRSEVVRDWAWTDETEGLVPWAVAILTVHGAPTTMNAVSSLTSRVNKLVEQERIRESKEIRSLLPQRTSKALVNRINDNIKAGKTEAARLARSLFEKRLLLAAIESSGDRQQQSAPFEAPATDQPGTVERAKNSQEMGSNKAAASPRKAKRRRKVRKGRNGQVPKHDNGPAPPNNVWWNGHRHSLENMPWRLLDFMWNRDQEPLQVMEAAVWGANVEVVASAVRATASKVNAFLRDMGIAVGWRLSTKAGYIRKMPMQTTPARSMRRLCAQRSASARRSSVSRQLSPES